ncbi:MAG: aldehyde dehydrogenase family protein [Planctomycetales bacterium]|nr:aldehyde dehydrogenase family protein [Planctomycetales bacterium]
MPDMSVARPVTGSQEMNAAVAQLTTGAQRLVELPLGKRRDLVEACILGVARNARAWVEAACQAKHIASDSALAAEEILGGHASLLRYLRLLAGTFRDVERQGNPSLPGRPRKNTLGRTCVPVLPVATLHDRMVFMGLRAEAWLQPGADESSLFASCLQPTNKQAHQIAGVLGAGNVSTIPATDTLYKIFHEHQAVLLKLNPVNDYLDPIFRDALKPLVDADLLRIVCGGRDIGEALVQHPGIDTLHLTGSHLTHDAIVWGADESERARRKLENQPLVAKPVTSELGNVTPWIIVPGDYSSKQLAAQAEHVAASIVNNGSFNCVATKMIVTARNWPQRDEFLNLLDKYLKAVPPRFAYYPGACERFVRATGQTNYETRDGKLPWTLIRDARPDDSPHLFAEESFVCVCAETALDEASPEAFLEHAVDFVNEQLFGTLCATLTVPDRFQKTHAPTMERAIERLRYGSVCINQWSGVVYGLMTPPWGGAPGSSLADPQSGIGSVHNTFFLDHVEKTVLAGPLRSLMKPVWFASHRTAHRVAWNLVDFYQKPSLSKLIPLSLNALRG